jgi:hypothetical protein
LPPFSQTSEIRTFAAPTFFRQLWRLFRNLRHVGLTADLFS